MNEIAFDGTLPDWKRAARSALTANLEPRDVRWIDRRLAQGEFFLGPGEAAVGQRGSAADHFRVPREFVALADEVGCHRDLERWAKLYRVLWRLTQGEPHLLRIATDSEVVELRAMAKAVHRDIHKMRAFVRFREVATADGPWFVAWFEPQHHIVEANAPFFRDRFAGMRWSILTPDRCAHWRAPELTFTAGVARDVAPETDAKEDLWRTYYSSIFNPARVKVAAMKKEMPRHYWKNLPETSAIPTLLSAARARTETMLAKSAAQQIGRDVFGAAPVPETRDLEQLREAAVSCRACPLWRNATCTVFGRGPSAARIVVVGEQPGDQEDRRGEPFVGPAGQLLDRAFVAAGLDRAALYLTNAVKHFKGEPRGKRRLHQRPNAHEIAACRPWLEAELRALQPELIICLGATAAHSVLGREVKVLRERGEKFETEFNAPALVTVHPSALLRLPATSDADAEFARFVADLRQARL